MKLNFDNYIFRSDNGITVQFKNKENKSVLDLSKLNIDIIGLMKDDNVKPWVVTIVTVESLQKLKLGITKSLQPLGFRFQTKRDAMKAQKFIVEGYHNDI